MAGCVRPGSTVSSGSARRRGRLRRGERRHRLRPQRLGVLLPGRPRVDVTGEVHDVVQNPADRDDVLVELVDEEVTGLVNRFGRRAVTAESQVPRADAVTQFGSLLAADPCWLGHDVVDGGAYQRSVADRRLDNELVF